MTTIVAAFYADIPYKPSRFGEFLPFIQASQRALAITNPGAHYTILTDSETAPLLYEADISYRVIVPTHMPLMCKIIYAQRTFLDFMVHTGFYDYIILPDVDCLANRDLEEALPDNVGMAITHKGSKFRYKINNLAYIRDKKKGFWFLDRAYEIVRNYPDDKKEWEGDQEAWEESLEPPLGEELYHFERVNDDILISRPEGKDIYIYPCNTHNCFMPHSGKFYPKHDTAFMIHFKGDRKQHMQTWMGKRFGNEKY